jgi:hypothetical protein
VENFFLVQYVTPGSTDRTKKAAEIRGLFFPSTVKPHGGMAALQSAVGHCGERTHRKYRR